MRRHGRSGPSRSMVPSSSAVAQLSRSPYSRGPRSSTGHCSSGGRLSRQKVSVCADGLNGGASPAGGPGLLAPVSTITDESQQRAMAVYRVPVTAVEEVTGQAGALQPRQLIVTLYGLYAREHGSWLSVAA